MQPDCDLSVPVYDLNNSTDVLKDNQAYNNSIIFHKLSLKHFIIHKQFLVNHIFIPLTVSRESILTTVKNKYFKRVPQHEILIYKSINIDRFIAFNCLSI